MPNSCVISVDGDVALPPLMFKLRTEIAALSTAMLSLGTLIAASAAQDPIHVETNQVLVPVIVADESRFRGLWKGRTLVDAVLPGELDAIMSGVLVHDLTAADFQVRDDDKEQPIQRVTEQPSIYWNVRDNRGHHTEYIGPGGGKWSTAEWPADVSVNLEAPQYYVIAYDAPDSPEGSCHQIQVKVNRPNVLVAARDEYCNTKHSSLDPASGTRLGQLLTTVLNSPKGSNEIGEVSLAVVPLYADADIARVHIALDWPSKSMKNIAGAKAVLGLVFNKEGNLVTRFSDLAERQGVADHGWPEWPGFRGVAFVERRYETQITLPSGEYDFRVIVGDGKRFGRAQVHTAVRSFNPKELSVSAVSLCKQVDDVSASSSRFGSVLPGVWTLKYSGNYTPLVSNDVEFKPTGNTRFKKGETLYTYFEVFEPLLTMQPPATVQFQMRIVDVQSGQLRSDSQPIDATPYVKEGNPLIRIGRGINIEKLPKGLYRLDITATDSAGRASPDQTADFTVE